MKTGKLNMTKLFSIVVIRQLICKVFGHSWRTKPKYYEKWMDHYVDYCPVCGKIHQVRSYWVDD